MIQDRAIITSVSNKFFPSVINLIGSIKHIHPNHPHIYVYDLGLWNCFRKELEHIPGVSVVDMPGFVPFWRACYTWKTYIFVHPFATLNLYLDAGTQVLRPLDEMFNGIDRDGYFAVFQGIKNEKIIPPDYLETFGVSNSIMNEYAVTAGVFGFKKDGHVSQQLNAMHDASCKGYCLGFSQGELWKNKGVNKTEHIRNCPNFRHDTTLLNIFLRKNNTSFKAHDVNKYAGATSPKDHPEQVIWNVRMNYKTLEFLKLNSLWNRFLVTMYLWGRQVRLTIKKLI